MKLVLLPGLDGTGRLFEPLMQVLPSHLLPVVVSYPNDRALSYSELVELVQQEVPANEDYALVAESFSGPVAIEISASNPAKLKALVLIATFVSNPSLLPKLMRSLLRGILFSLEPPQFLVGRYLLGDNPPVDLVETFRRAKRSVRPDVLAFRMRSVINVDVRPAFAACRVPILYLRAKQDRLVKARSAAQMEKIQPGMSLVEIRGPHLLLQREPEKCVEAIVQYLALHYD